MNIWTAVVLTALGATVIGWRCGLLIARHAAEVELERVLVGVRHEHRIELKAERAISDDADKKLIEWDDYAKAVAVRDAEMEERLTAAQKALAREMERSDQMLAQMGDVVMRQRTATAAIPAAFREPLETLIARQPYAEPVINLPDAEPVWERLHSAPWPTIAETVKPAMTQGDGPLVALAAGLWKELAVQPAGTAVEQQHRPRWTLPTLEAITAGQHADLVIVDDNGPDIPASILDAQLAWYREHEHEPFVAGGYQVSATMDGEPATVTFAPVDTYTPAPDPKPNWRDVVTGYVVADDGAPVITPVGGDAWSVGPLDATRLDIMAPIRERPRKTYPAKKNAVKKRKGRR